VEIIEDSATLGAKKMPPNRGTPWKPTNRDSSPPCEDQQPLEPQRLNMIYTWRNWFFQARPRKGGPHE
jgi:hypothetical protein